MKAAAGFRSSRPRAASSSRRRTGSAPIPKSSTRRSRRRNSGAAAAPVVPPMKSNSRMGNKQGDARMGRSGSMLALVAGVAAAALAGTAAAQQKEVMIGMQCDRTGATQITGVVLCPAMHDYYNLVNAGGGVEGYKIKVDEIDNEFYNQTAATEIYPLTHATLVR